MNVQAQTNLPDPQKSNLRRPFYTKLSRIHPFRTDLGRTPSYPTSHPPPTIALPLYTLTPEPTPITTPAAPTATLSRTNHLMVDAPYRRARTPSRPSTSLPYQLDPRPPFCDTTTFSHPLRPTLMTYARRTHSQTLNFTLSYHLYISPTTRDQQPSPDYIRS